MTEAAPATKRSRVGVFLVAAVLLGTPAVALHALCVGKSCDATASSTDRTPFCSLPADVRTAVERGFFEGRGGEIMAVTGPLIQEGSSRSPRSGLLWPSASSEPVIAPVVFSGSGVASGVSLPAGTGLDDVAPTIAALIDLDRPHPQVRSGSAIEEALTPRRQTPRIVLEVIWKGVGPETLERRLPDLPNLSRLVSSGASTFSATTLSLPHDPAALVTTIGTGGVPSEHGVTGEIVRNELGRATTAWDKSSPINVIATLGDHLDELTGDRSVIAGVGTDVSDRGVIGGRWFPGGDRDEFSIQPTVARQVATSKRVLRTGEFGDDTISDLFAVVQEGSLTELDRALGALLEEAERLAGDSVLVVVAGTGRASGNATWDSIEMERGVERAVNGRGRVIEEARLGSFFLDQKVLARRKLSSDVVLQALLGLRHEGRAVFADAFPSIAVSFGRYCDG